jgi:hypothetical protein
MGAMAKFGMSGATTTVSLFMTKAIDRLGNGVQVGGGVTVWSWPSRYSSQRAQLSGSHGAGSQLKVTVGGLLQTVMVDAVTAGGLAFGSGKRSKGWVLERYTIWAGSSKALHCLHQHHLHCLHQRLQHTTSAAPEPNSS